jgi:hypothetical protein
VILDVIAIEVGKEPFKPFVHNLMVGPSVLEFGKENGASLSGLGLESGKYSDAKVVFNGFAVSLIEFPGPIVGRTLCTHVVECTIMKNGGVRQHRNAQYTTLISGTYV